MEISKNFAGYALDQVNIAYDISRNSHFGQFRRDGITPYFEHPLKVAELLL